MADTSVVITANANQAVAEYERLRAAGSASLQDLANNGTRALQSVGASAAQQAQAMRMVPAQLTDIVVSLQSGQAPLTVLLQQGGQLRDMFGSAGGAARGLASYVVSLVNPFTAAAAAGAVLALAYKQGSEEADAFRKALVMSGNAAGTTTGQMADMAKNISKSVGTQGEAAAALTELAATGQVGAENLEQFGKVAIQLEKTVGRSTAETAKDLAELGKEPLKASQKLSEQYHYLTSATYDQIKALEDQGLTEEAGAVAQKAYADAMDKRTKEITANLGTIEKAWQGVTGMAKGAWDSMLDIGREEGFEQKLAKANAALKRAKDARLTYIGGGADGKADLDNAQARVDQLLAQQKAEKQAATAKADSVKLEEAKTEWAADGVPYLARQLQLEKEIVAIRNKGKAAQASPEEIDARIRDVKRTKYSDLSNAPLAALEAQRNLEKEVMSGSLADLESRHRQRLVGEQAYITAKRNIQLKDLDGDMKVVRAQIEIASGKADLAERAKYVGALAVLQQRRANIIREAEGATAEVASKPANAIAAQAEAWKIASETERAALQDEAALFGQSDEARKIAVAQIKVEVEARQLLASWKKDGHEATDKERAALAKLTDERKADIAATMGQQQARAGAEQLRKENERYAADSIADPVARAQARLEIDANEWRERIRLAGSGTEEQKRLQTQFNTWYANQSKSALASADVTRANEALKVMEALDTGAREAAAGMEASFGRVGKAIGGLTTALTGYSRMQAAIAAKLAQDTQDSKGDPAKLAKANAAAQELSARVQIKSYGDMAGAAKGFFKEKSNGYKVLEGAEKAFRAYEMAMELKSMLVKSGLLTSFTSLFVAAKTTETAAEVAKTGTSVALAGTQASAWGVTAVVKAIASLPFPFNLAAGAATLAAVVAIGARVAGSVGGGGADTTAQDRQKVQGTGSVLGDSSAKSDSIAKALELTAANSGIELSHTAGMLASLRNIESSLAGLGSVVARASGITGKLAPNQAGGAAEFGRSTLGVALAGGVIGLALDKLTGGLVGKITGAVLGKIFGGKVTTLDTGITADKAALGSVLTNGLAANQYTDVKKDGGWFRSDKYSTNLAGLGAEGSAQLTKVVSGLASGVAEAGKLLGVGGDDFTRHLNEFVVDIGKISLKDLKGDEIQKALESVFAKVGDDMAKFGVGGLDQFQKVGEGYFETLTRVANNYANLDSILAVTGTAFGATGLASIAAREHLIELAGGISDLASKSSSFAENFLTEAERLVPVQKYVTEQLAAMGLAGIDTRDKFKDAVLGLANSGKLATDAGAQQYTTLLDLASAFNKLYPATEKAATAQEIARSKRELEIRTMELQGDKIGALAAKREMELAEVDKTIRSTAAMVAAFEDLKNAQDAYESAVSSAKSAMQNAASSYQGFVDRVRDTGKAFADAGKAIGDAYTKALNTDNDAKKKVAAEQGKITDGYIAATDKVVAAQQKVVDSFSKLGTTLQDFLTSLDTTDIAGASAEERYAALTSQFTITAARARAGDTDAGGKLPEIAKDLLAIGKTQAGTSTDFNRLVASVRGTVGSVAALAAGRVAGNKASSEESDLAKALAEQARWTEAVTSSGASFTKSADSLLAGYQEAVQAQQQSGAELIFWSQILARTGVTVGTAWQALQTNGAELVNKFADAQFEMRKAQIELDAANEIRAGLELRQATSLENFVTTIKEVNKTAVAAKDAAAALFAAAGNKLLEGSAATLKAQEIAREGMAYWGSVVTTTASGIAASVQAMANAASAIAAAQAAQTANQVVPTNSGLMSANESMVRGWYANNAQYQSNGHGSFYQVQQFEVDYWLNRLKTEDAASIKAQFAIAAARDSGFKTPLAVSAFAAGGDHIGGLRLVGENGPELEVTGPSRIFNASQTRNILNGAGNSEVVALLRAILAKFDDLGEDYRLGAAAGVGATKALERFMRDMSVNGTALRAVLVGA